LENPNGILWKLHAIPCRSKFNQMEFTLIFHKVEDLRVTRMAYYKMFLLLNYYLQHCFFHKRKKEIFLQKHPKVKQKIIHFGFFSQFSYKCFNGQQIFKSNLKKKLLCKKYKWSNLNICKAEISFVNQYN
jgi:hypothetical protein